MTLYVMVEGWTDEIVIRRLARDLGAALGAVLVKHGSDQLDSSLKRLSGPAHHQCWLVVRDLDRGDCAVSLRRALLSHEPPRLRLRIAVRMMEAWLLADRQSAADWLSVPVTRIPMRPELELDAKRVIVDLARRSRSKGVQRDIVPAEGSTARVGPGYSSRLLEYVDRIWRPEVARLLSSSLEGCIRSIEALAGMCGCRTPVSESGENG